MKPFKINSEVHWKWLGGVVEGVVKEVYLAPVERVIKGKKIKRNGSPEKPAYLVESKAGNLALKLHTELVSPAAPSTKNGKASKRRSPSFDIDRLKDDMEE